MKPIQKLTLMFIFLIVQSCQNKDQYTEVDQEEVIELIKSSSIDFVRINYRDEYGQPLSDSLKQFLNQGKLVRRFYRNSNGKIDQVRLSKVTSENIFHEIRIRELQKNPFRDITYAEISCSNSKRLLERALKRDQGVRKGLIKNNPNSDKLNQDTIISILDKCNWPSTNEEVLSVWYILQHSDSGKMAYYYPELKEMVNQGYLEDSLMAKMEDRILMYNGFPQIYGTQITPPSAFHEIEDVRNVNERRKRVGLCPIEQKAKSVGFEFKMEDYLK